MKKQIEDWIFLEREQRQLYENGVDFQSTQNIFLKDRQTSNIFATKSWEQVGLQSPSTCVAIPLSIDWILEIFDTNF